MRKQQAMLKRQLAKKEAGALGRNALKQPANWVSVCS